MPTENQENRASFICYNCKHETFYLPSAYIEKRKELLLEMKTYKTKQVIIHCSNKICRTPNSITITYI